MNALVLQHIACEPPGVYEDVLRERDVALHRVEIDEGEALPDWREFDAIVAMGGPMSVNDEPELPWLVDEKRTIAEAVRAGTPYWGACLGVQLLASSLGARVYAGPRPEVGVMPVTLTEDAAADPVFQGLPNELLTLQWHGDTFELPKGAIRLASSPEYENQAFRFGRAGYVPEYEEYLDRVHGPGSATRLIAELEERSDGMLESGRRMFERWLELASA